MSTTTHLGAGRYRHREGMSLPAYAVPRTRTLDARQVGRVIDREVDKALRPMNRQIREIGRQLDAVAKVQAANGQRLAPVLAKLTPVLAARDGLARGVRQTTPTEVNAANRARYGRDAEGRVPGQPGFGVVHNASAGTLTSPAAVNARNAAFWGRKA